jgi:flavodoxin
MKTLVTYYSKTGNTKEVAKQIAKELNADIDEIVDKTNRDGFINYIKSGFHALRKKLTKITTKKDPSNYHLVIIGTPIWAGREAPAVRTYMKENNLKKVAFFCTAGGKQSLAFKNMEELSQKPLAKLEIKAKQIPKSTEIIKKFCAYLK